MEVREGLWDPDRSSPDPHDWQSRTRDAWNTFRARFAGEFEELDARCERPTVSERELGTFEPVD